MAGKDYDVAAAFQAIEYELINSFFRNMKKHKVDEVKEQKQWEMWQVKQLQELDLYKKRNAEKYGTKFTDINKTIAEMIRLSNEEGQMDQEAEILSAMDKGLRPQRAPEQMTAQFFRTNDRKLDTLINATVSDMEKAEVAVLRKADDVYRKTIFNAIVYANTGAGTYEKAIDMATKDFMKAGLTCVEYKNGSKHTISDYADMAVRTANKRAYLQGEGTKRQEWGIHTVIVNKRLRACPHCMPFAGKVFIDDVWGGGTAADGDYPLLSEAVAAGLYHPRCKDSHTAYFPGITGKPKKYTRAEVKEAEKAEEQERKADYAERQAESYQRLADTRLDPENKRLEQARANRWDEFEADEGVDYNGIPKAWKYTGAISTSDALKGTNPHYLQSIPEYLKGTRDDYTNNCANCVPAYEMRKRGYVVTACSVGENRRLKRKPFTAWKDRQPQTATGNGLTEILEFIGNSSDDMRVEIAITFESRGLSDSNSGHVFIAEKEGGEIQFLDPQSGRIISKNIFKNVRENATMYMRIDDLEISDRGVTACKVGE